MRILLYTVILLTFIVLGFSACSKEDITNEGTPSMSGIKFNVNTSIIYLSDTINNVYDTILVNPSGKLENELDTLLLGNSVTINAGTLKAPNGLTNMKVKIYGDTLVNEVDTCVNLTEVPYSYFFGKTEYEISTKITVSSTFSSTLTNPSTTVTKNVRQGTEYKFNIYLIDRQGNIDSVSYFQKPIVILSQDSIINAWKNKTRNN